MAYEIQITDIGDVLDAMVKTVGDNNLTIDTPEEDLPQDIKDAIERFSSLNQRMAAEQPVHVEYHHDELVEVAIPYSQLLNAIGAMQISAETSLNASRKAAGIVQMMISIGNEQAADGLSEHLHMLVKTTLEFIDLGAQLNDIRLLVRPEELTDPHTGEVVKLGPQLSDKDQEDLTKIGESDFDSWLQGLAAIDPEEAEGVAESNLWDEMVEDFNSGEVEPDDDEE